MERENLLILTLALCAMLIAPCGLAAAGKDYGAVSVTKVSTDPTDLNPGMPMTLKLKLTFSGDKALEDLTLAVDPKYPFSVREGHPTIEVIGDVVGRPVIYKDFYLDVDEGAQEGTYKLDIITCHPTCEELREETELTLEIEADPLMVIASTTVPDTISSGTATEVRIALRNAGKGVAENVRATVATTPEGSEDTTLFSLRGTGNVFALGDVLPGRLAYIDLVLQTSARASGFYTLPITIEDDSGSTNPTLQLGLQVDKTEPVVELAEIEGLDTFTPGETKNLVFVLRNAGSAVAKNVRFSLTRVSAYQSQEQGAGGAGAAQAMMANPTMAMVASAAQMVGSVSLPVTVDGVIPLGSSQYLVRELAADAQARFAVQVYAAPKTPEGAYQLTAALAYEDALGTESSAESIIGISVQGKPELRLGDTSVDPEKVRAGDDDVLLALDINNVGTGMAKNVVAVATSDALDFGGNRRSVLGNLAKDTSSSAQLRFDVPEDTKPGDYLVTVDLSFTDTAGASLAGQQTYTLIVNEKPKLSIGELKASALRPGDEFELTITVQNTGSEEAESASIKAVVEGDVPFVFETKSDYLGNIAPGQTAVGVLAGRIESDGTPKDYRLAFELRAVGDRDIGDSNVYVFEDTQNLAVTGGGRRVAGEDAPLSSQLGPIVAVVLLASGLVYYVTRKPDTTDEKK
ncbi:MAG: COG1361 S-layer family protein [Methanopyri archaeon]|nr:COG1361 S-layer family protein [Methanopyri archaeon]